LYFFIAAICFFTFPELAPLSNAQEQTAPQSTIDNSKEPSKRSLADLKRDLETAENLKGSEHHDLIPILQNIAKARREVGLMSPRWNRCAGRRPSPTRLPGKTNLRLPAIST